MNCVAAFNAGLLTPAVEQLRTAGFDIDDTDVAHLGPTMSEHISVHGRYHFDLDGPAKGLKPAPTPRRDAPADSGNREPTFAET